VPERSKRRGDGGKRADEKVAALCVRDRGGGHGVMVEESGGERGVREKWKREKSGESSGVRVKQRRERCSRKERKVEEREARRRKRGVREKWRREKSGGERGVRESGAERKAEKVAVFK
jgi:hypothetical protein